MAERPNFEMRLSVVDADKILAEMRELRDEIRRLYTYTLIAGFFTVILWSAVAIKRFL